MTKEINNLRLQEISSFLTDLQTSLDDERAQNRAQATPLSASPTFDQEKFDRLVGSLSQIMNRSAPLTQEQQQAQKEENAFEFLAAMSADERRKMALTSNDELLLSILASDENFNIRTLALCNPSLPEAALVQAIPAADNYTLMLITHHPRATATTLEQVFAGTVQGIKGEDEILQGILGHPHASESLKHQVTERLSQLSGESQSHWV